MSIRTPVTGPTTRLNQTPSRNRPFLSLALGGLLFVFALTLTRWLNERSTHITAPPQTTPTLLLGEYAERRCPEAEAHVVQRQLAVGQWEAASAAASQALPIATGCVELEQTLRQALRQAGAELLLATKAQPGDHTVQMGLVQSYRALPSAQVMPGVLSNFQLARRAYDAYLFPLTRAALEQGWVEEPEFLNDRSLAQLYASTLYNIAFWGADEQQEPGASAQLLVTAICVERAFELSSAASYALLANIAGHEPAAWPASLATPVLGDHPCVLDA